ncbi:hypothetical protein [Hippea jasoniae]|uniref:hypothetical protein n=1 Tax=Hippea jasoniae TaxID=944479 RepID=UPI00054F5E8F|nr:hypothetical protein [Hippea jasoniae]
MNKKRTIINFMLNHLKNILSKTSLNEKHVIESLNIYNDIDNDILLRTQCITALKKFLKYSKPNKIAIYPCNSYIEKIIDVINEYNFVILDDFKAGKKIKGYTVISPEVINAEKFDHIIIVSYRDSIKNSLIQRVGNDASIVWIKDLVQKYIDKDIYLDMLHGQKLDVAKVDFLLKKIHFLNDNVLISINGVLFNNYGPTFKSLQKKGYKIYVLTLSDNLAYAKQDSTIHDFVIKNCYKLTTLEMVYFCLNLKKGNVFINDISFYNPGFDAKKAIINYAFVAFLLSIIKVPKFLFLYDVVHSVIKNHEYINDYFQIYRKTLLLADGIICNSNTDEIHNTLKYIIGIDKPMLSFYRYNEYIPKLRKKIDNGEFHIVIIGGMGDKLRDSTNMLKEILSQRIHVHNYVASDTIYEFMESLKEEQKRYFHQHNSIVSQFELIEEISQYHAGWIVDNGFEVLDMINSINHKELKELLIMFRLTTVSSSLLAVGAAGLPMFLNRMVVHVTYKFPKEFFIPIEEPEIINFKKIIKDIKWNELYRVTMKERKIFYIDTHIEKLIEFISKVRKEFYVERQNT